uniref:Methyltransferase n=1 Tax=viral metagenome TaxID=1070528 RepID=A0A6C0B9D9_9ZZZZ
MQNSEQPAILFNKASNKKLDTYIDKLQALPEKHIADFALYTPINSMQSFLAKYELMKMIQGIPGAVIEMGVCSGNGLMSLIHCHNILQPTYKYREFYGFDTFEGFPDVHENDIANIKWEKGDFSNNCYDKLNNIIDIHGSYCYAAPPVQLIKGNVNETLPEFLKENKHIIVSLLYLDLDIYEPTKTALKHLLPKMAKGSIIAFDELNWKSFPGETIAVLEELGTKYKFVNLLNSRINYCVIV